MKITTPKREIEVCDTCQVAGYLQHCIVCGGAYCLSHNAIITGCWVAIRACQRCGDRDDVQAICGQFAKKITPIVKTRREALRTLGTELKKEQENVS